MTAPQTKDALTAQLQQGMTLLRAGKLGQSEQAFQQALAMHPDCHEAYFGLGLVYFSAQQSERAATHVAKAISLSPTTPGYYNQLGNIAVALQKLDLAAESFLKAITLAPGFAEAHHSYGIILFKQGKYEEAYTHFEKAVELNPNLVPARVTLGRYYVGKGRWADACAQFDAAIALKPGDVKMLSTIGNACQTANAIDPAIKYFEMTLAVDDNLWKVHNNMGCALEAKGEAKAAIRHYRKAINISPNNPILHNNYGNAYAKSGEIDKAIKQYQKASALDPQFAASFANVTRFKKFTVEDSAEINRLEELLLTPGLSQDHIANLHFALGKVYDDIKNFEKAFTHYKKGNDMVNSTVVIAEAEEFARIYESSREVFTKEFFAERTALGHPSDRPIFVVGMPRSGSTLVEQIISSHPDVVGGNEIGHMQHLRGVINQVLKSDKPYPYCMPEITQDHVMALAKSYLEKLDEIDNFAPRIIDKMLYNFLSIGIIQILFPNAKIIHCSRHPLDSCLSSYFQKFAAGNTYTYNLEKLGSYYRCYLDFMQLWDEVLPSKVHEVYYADMVDDQEGESRKLLEFLGLPWDERCLQFHKNSRTVLTASLWQVRQPMYKTSKARWEKYDPYIGELKAAMGWDEIKGKYR